MTAAEAEKGNWEYKRFTVNGETATSQMDTCVKATLVSKAVSGDPITWSSGFYVLDQNITVNKWINIERGADVKLILLDNTTLRAERGINIDNRATLSIFEQTYAQRGKIIANEKENAGVGIGTGN